MIAEALTNVAKYAGATSAGVSLSVEHGHVRLLVRDDGAGGANLNAGTGLRGLRDRVEALGGELDLESREGAGTTLVARLPCG